MMLRTIQVRMMSGLVYYLLQEHPHMALLLKPKEHFWVYLQSKAKEMGL